MKTEVTWEANRFKLWACFLLFHQFLIRITKEREVSHTLRLYFVQRWINESKDSRFDRNEYNFPLCTRINIKFQCRLSIILFPLCSKVWTDSGCGFLTQHATVIICLTEKTINRRQMGSSSRLKAFFKFGLFWKTVPSILLHMLLHLFCLNISSVCTHTRMQTHTQNLKINYVAEGDSIWVKGVVNHRLNMKDGQWVEPKIFYAPLLHAIPPVCGCSVRICVAHKRPDLP